MQLWITTRAPFVQPATLSKYLMSLQTIHTEHGWSVEALHSPILKWLIAAAERRFGMKSRKPCCAITRETSLLNCQMTTTAGCSRRRSCLL
jgi:hypothetical protein